LFKTYLVRGSEFKNNKNWILKAFYQDLKGAEKQGILIKGAIFLIKLSPRSFYLVNYFFEKLKNLRYLKGDKIE